MISLIFIFLLKLFLQHILEQIYLILWKFLTHKNVVFCYPSDGMLEEAQNLPLSWNTRIETFFGSGIFSTNNFFPQEEKSQGVIIGLLISCRSLYYYLSLFVSIPCLLLGYSADVSVCHWHVHETFRSLFFWYDASFFVLFWCWSYSKWWENHHARLLNIFSDLLVVYLFYTKKPSFWNFSRHGNFSFLRYILLKGVS